MTGKVSCNVIAPMAAILFMAGMSTVHAADLGGAEPIPEPVPIPDANADWAGVYFGGHSGGDLDGDNDVLGGLQLGHSWQNGSIVFGAEGDVSFSGDTFGSIRARAGIARGPWLLFGTAGLAVDDDDTGLVAGGGLEYKVAHNTTIGLEALNYDLDGNFTVLRGRLTWRFGGSRL